MPHRNNFLLSRLDNKTAEDLSLHLRVTELRHGAVLADSYKRVQRVYFAHSGIISSVVEMKDGSAIETGMVGRDGVFGATQALDDKVSLNKVVVQVPGVASVMDADRLCAMTAANKALRRLLVEYELFFLAQVQQTAACNASHSIEPRMCKWLIRMHDLAGPDLRLTHEYLAQMIGVRRTSITAVAGKLQRKGMISYRRGRVHIQDIRKIRETSCECHEGLSTQYNRLFKDVRLVHEPSILRSQASSFVVD
jgi:CRP-like cAMP-binding protein